MNLSEKNCIPCQQGIKPLDTQEIQKFLEHLGQGWEINNNKHLYKKYQFENFEKAMCFANKIALLAEEQRHHPDLKIGWGICSVEIWTHKINGLSESDFYLTEKIEEL